MWRGDCAEGGWFFFLIILGRCYVVLMTVVFWVFFLSQDKWVNAK